MELKALFSLPLDVICVPADVNGWELGWRRIRQYMTYISQHESLRES
jgi:hypothetical protein